MTTREHEPRHAPAAEQLESAVRVLSELLSAREEVVVAFFHGSAARGEPFRDLDIAVLADRERVSSAEDFRYSARLADELSRGAGFPVDVRIANDAPPVFRDRVSRGRVLACRSDRELVRFKERAWDDWFDFRPVAHAYLREMAG